MQLVHDQIEPVTFKAGEILFKENEQSFHFFILQEGKVEVFKTAEGGEKVPLAIVADGTSIGEFAMIDRLPRSATAQAMTSVKAMKVSEAAYQSLLADLPEWAVSVMISLVERLRATNEIIRRSKIIDPDLRTEINSVEYDPDSSKVTIESARDPYDDNGTPDLV